MRVLLPPIITNRGKNRIIQKLSGSRTIRCKIWARSSIQVCRAWETKWKPSSTYVTVCRNPVPVPFVKIRSKNW